MTSSDKPCHQTTVLLILDGYGHGPETDHNAIYAANTPVMDTLWQTCPHGLITGSGAAVGLPDGQMGNSEVGHMHLGAGRVVYQDLTRINRAITDGTFFTNPVLTQAIDETVSVGKAVHIMGLLSPGGVHSHADHCRAMIDLAKRRGATALYVHAFLDGRDTPPRSAESTLAAIDNLLRKDGQGRIASVIGRYYAMDRDNRWERTQAAYELLTEGSADYQADTAVAGLTAAYQRQETDEFVSATAIAAEGEPVVTVNDGDALIFMNFRADRARALTRAFTDQAFSGFQRRRRPILPRLVTLTQYAADLNVACAFPPATLRNTLGECLAAHGKTQLRLAETEKYAHVTFFFNGGREQPYTGETRRLVASPAVATYDQQPEMSAFAVTEQLVAAINSGRYDIIICNYANCDMVGHTGQFTATVKAVETVDTCIGQVIAALKGTQGQCLITADHGNAEQMLDPTTGQAHTAHTCQPVPLIYVGPHTIQLCDGSLSDVAPTLLTLMGLEQPADMTGRSLATWSV